MMTIKETRPRFIDMRLDTQSIKYIPNTTWDHESAQMNCVSVEQCGLQVCLVVEMTDIRTCIVNLIMKNIEYGIYM